MTNNDYIAIIAAIIAVAAALFSLLQAYFAKQSVEQQNLIRLFEAFEESTNRLYNSPSLLTQVHGFPQDRYSDADAQALTYLCALLDTFQLFYERKYKGDFKKMAVDLKRNSNFLSRLLANPDNHQRIEDIRRYFYGDFDADFFDAINDVIRFQNSQR